MDHNAADYDRYHNPDPDDQTDEPEDGTHVDVDGDVLVIERCSRYVHLNLITRATNLPGLLFLPATARAVAADLLAAADKIETPSAPVARTAAEDLLSVMVEHYGLDTIAAHDPAIAARVADLLAAPRGWRWLTACPWTPAERLSPFVCGLEYAGRGMSSVWWAALDGDGFLVTSRTETTEHHEAVPLVVIDALRARAGA